MIVKHYTTEAQMVNPFNLQVIKFHDSAEAELLHLTLDAGESMLLHIPPVNLLYYILAGEPMVRVGDEKYYVQPESYVESPAGLATCVSNPSQTKVRLLIVKTSKSDEKPIFLTEENE